MDGVSDDKGKERGVGMWGGGEKESVRVSNSENGSYGGWKREGEDDLR